MNLIVENTHQEDLPDQNWRVPSKEGYDENDVIKAYKAGVDKGEKNMHEAIIAKLEENIASTGMDTSKLIDRLKSKGFHPKSAHLRIISWAQFDILVSLPESEFLSDEFLDIYSFVTKIENELDEKYEINVSFVGHTDNFDIEALRSDGYALTYKNLQNDVTT